MTDPDKPGKKSRVAAKPKREAPKATPPAADGGSNAILFQDDKPSTGGGSLRVERTPKAERAGRGKSTAAAGEDARAKQVPDTVRERFIQIGNDFYFPDGAEAFTDHGNRVTTRSENAIVIQSMVAIAQARSAGKVTVTGTDFFKKEAWFAARLAGLEVSGYTPTALEQERLVRALARRRTAESGEKTPVRGAAERPNSRAGRTPAKPAEQAEFIVGRLVDHGPAPYQHKPGQPMSYYVRIETEHGDREIWGVDLERAVRQSLSTPGVGDEVGLRAVGRDPVTVIAPRLDPSGREVGRDELGVHRNKWILETKEFLDRRFQMADTFRNASISAAEAVKQYAELEGSYLQLQMARAGVEQRIASAEAREQFVDHLRAHLAKTIEHGQPLEPVHLKARAKPVPEKAQERDLVPDR
ncbi:MAG TPA: LPD7 domain-containing protein [Vicinamibacterales bacterium]|jgi:putative DNA primase/helicase|nr:LPD7 domain-containing protein [Vicinamibacterales bacterium]